ncbi:MAG TPA: protein-disulfide reductase DsbD domain-containing protein [Vicinamibacterales bacterium]
MRMLVLGASALALALIGQSRVSTVPASQAANTHDTKHLRVTTSVAPGEARPGGRLSLAAAIVPKPTMHVYAPGQEGYIGVTLTLDRDPSAFTAAGPKYPPPQKRVLPGINETELVYSQPFTITDDVTLPRGASGRTTIKGTLRYQACDDVVCYLPATVPLEWRIDVR